MSYCTQQRSERHLLEDFFSLIFFGVSSLPIFPTLEMPWLSSVISISLLWRPVTAPGRPGWTLQSPFTGKRELSSPLNRPFLKNPFGFGIYKIFKTSKTKMWFKNALFFIIVPDDVLSSVIFQLSCRTGEWHLHYKGTEVTCFYSPLRVESLKNYLYCCCFYREKPCLC